MQEHTNGQGVLVPKEACEAFATVVLLSYSTIHNTATPQGCYVVGETIVFNNNTNGTSCSFTHRCIKFDETITPSTMPDTCVGIRNRSNSFALIEGLRYGGISVVAEGQVFNDSSCYVEHASVASAADCEVFAQSVPFSLAFEGEEQRYGKVFFFSYDTSGLCRVIKPGFSLATCTTSSSLSA